jgi:hypothetical protein
MIRNLFCWMVSVALVGFSFGQDPLIKPQVTGEPIKSSEIKPTRLEDNQGNEEVLPAPVIEPAADKPPITIIGLPKSVPAAPNPTPFSEPRGGSASKLPSPSVKNQIGDGVVVLREDKTKYRSENNFSTQVSDYRFEIAKERARARRMRIEAKKWYGVDSARPNVIPNGHVPTYSAYYNGFFSPSVYPINRGQSFYFYQSFAR